MAQGSPSGVCCTPIRRLEAVRSWDLGSAAACTFENLKGSRTLLHLVSVHRGQTPRQQRTHAAPSCIIGSARHWLRDPRSSPQRVNQRTDDIWCCGTLWRNVISSRAVCNLGLSPDSNKSEVQSGSSVCCEPPVCGRQVMFEQCGPPRSVTGRVYQCMEELATICGGIDGMTVCASCRIVSVDQTGFARCCVPNAQQSR